MIMNRIRNIMRNIMMNRSSEQKILNNIYCTQCEEFIDRTTMHFVTESFFTVSVMTMTKYVMKFQKYGRSKYRN